MKRRSPPGSPSPFPDLERGVRHLRLHPRRKILDVNPALINMLGHASVEAVRQLDVKRDVFVDPLELDRLVEDYRCTGSLIGVEVQWRRKDAGVIIVRLSGGAATITDEPGEVLELIAEDIRNGVNSKSSCARRKKWMPSADSPVASPTTSTIC